MSTQRKWAIALMALGGLSILTGLYLEYIVLDYLLNPLTWAGIVGSSSGTRAKARTMFRTPTLATSRTPTH